GNPRPSVVHFWTTEGIQDEELSTDPVFFTKLNALDLYRVDTVESVSTTHTTRQLVCEARNEDGAIQHRIRFNVNKPGSPPGSIKYVVSPENSATLSWNKPSLPNGNITGYLAYITQNLSDPLDEWRRIVIDSNRRRFTFVEGELDRNSTYYLRMTASNAYGEGILSEVVEIITANGGILGPTSAPTDVLVDVDELNTLNISWIPPENPNGLIKEYIFYFTRNTHSAESSYRNWQSVVISNITPLTNQYLFNGEMLGIRRDCDYRLRVAARNEVAEGPPSEVAHFKTRSGLFAAPNGVNVLVDMNGDAHVRFNVVYDKRKPNNAAALTVNFSFPFF
uniref:Fibronectin type-III domain-containing protein n=1 Tax=Ascaris lumbricoides TaxID=6252 RepID=A0A9J2QBB2_ASCLU